MAEYPLPPWLSPSAAQGYGELAGSAAKAALSAQLEREQLSQKAAQFSIESQQRSQEIAAANQAKQEQLNYEHQLDQQKLAVEQAYKQQQIGLQTADLDLAQKQFALKTEDAAKKFAAQQAFQKAIMPKEQGGEGLHPTEAALKYMAPFMTGTEVGRLAAMPADFKPGNTFQIPGAANEALVQVAPNRWDKYATTPQTITNAPNAIPVPDEEGNTIGHVIQLPGEKPRYEATRTTGSDLASLVRERQKATGGGGKSTAVDSKPRKAEGGYKIGAVYKGGLRYLGGPPDDENSWEKVK